MLKSKVVLLGNSTVGKTSILHQFKLNQFTQNVDSTIGCEFFAKSVFINNEEIKLLLWDTAGQEVFRSFTQNFLRGAKLVLIIFDVSNYSSFLNIEHWLNETKKISSNIKIIIAGNKSDLISQVTDNEIKELIKNKQSEYNFDYYGTLSARNYESVDKLFNYIGDKLLSDKSYLTESDSQDDKNLVDLEKDNEYNICCSIS